MPSRRRHGQKKKKQELRTWVTIAMEKALAAEDYKEAAEMDYIADNLEKATTPFQEYYRRKREGLITGVCDAEEA